MHNDGLNVSKDRVHRPIELIRASVVIELSRVKAYEAAGLVRAGGYECLGLICENITIGLFRVEGDKGARLTGLLA